MIKSSRTAVRPNLPEAPAVYAVADAWLPRGSRCPGLPRGRLAKLPRGRVPSPRGVGGEVRPAHPAVDAQQRDAVRPAREHLLSASDGSARPRRTTRR